MLVAGAGARGRLWISRVLVGTSLLPQECSGASHNFSLGKPGEVPAPCHYTGPTHPHTTQQMAKENESQTSGPHSRQLPWTLSLLCCPCSSFPALFLCILGFKPFWNYLLFVALHSRLRLAMLSFWPSQCSLRTGLPSSSSSCWSLVLGHYLGQFELLSLETLPWHWLTWPAPQPSRWWGVGRTERGIRKWWEINEKDA